jgi:hypothetical protein
MPENRAPLALYHILDALRDFLAIDPDGREFQHRP